MTNLKLTRPVAVIDVETTGTNVQEDRIVDICITKILPNGEKVTLSSLINPTIPIPAEATAVHGIKDMDVQGKPTFKEFALQIIEFIKNSDWCAFNAKFDLSLIESEFKRAVINYSSDGKRVIDVMRIYHILEPRDLSSAHLKYCGKVLEDAHKAKTDVKATIDVLEAQLEKHRDLPRDVSELNDLCNPKDPSWIDDDGKISWLNSNAVINFGKHKGRTLKEIKQTHPDYLQWMISSDFSSKVKEIVTNAMTGKFPEPTKEE